MPPHLLLLNLFIVFRGGGGTGGCLPGCLFWIVLSVGITIFINVVLILISRLISGPGPGLTSSPGRYPCMIDLRRAAETRS